MGDKSLFVRPGHIILYNIVYVNKTSLKTTSIHAVYTGKATAYLIANY